MKQQHNFIQFSNPKVVAVVVVQLMDTLVHLVEDWYHISTNDAIHTHHTSST